MNLAIHFITLKDAAPLLFIALSALVAIIETGCDLFTLHVCTIHSVLFCKCFSKAVKLEFAGG